jgi:AAHS family 4-hydroxybenzoate transporter-like MFS transporter
VTLTIVCIPVGGTLAGFLSARVLPAYGWHALFLVGGSLPLVLAALFWKALPESPRYLARQPARWPELAALLTRLGQAAAAASVCRLARTISRRRRWHRRHDRFRRDTSLCAAYFFYLLTVYMGVNWVPSLLTGATASASRPPATG